eukprot:237197-Prymnesium_polylepis.3
MRVVGHHVLKCCLVSQVDPAGPLAGVFRFDSGELGIRFEHKSLRGVGQRLDLHIDMLLVKGKGDKVGR